MADNPEIARARRLLKSSEEMLERSRNRPHVEVREWRSEPEKQAPAPVVRKRIERAQVSRKMDSETQKRWNEWADRRVMIGTKALCAAIMDTLGKRIADLEREIASLKEKPKPKLEAVGGRDG